MKRLVCLAAVLFAVASVLPQLADAKQKKKEIRFAKESAQIDEKGNLKLEFKLVGLSEYQKVEYDVTGDVTVTEACQTNGGNFPNDPKKTEEEGPIFSKYEDFADGKGSVEGELVVEPLDTSLECSGGQEDVLVKVEYDVKLAVKIQEEIVVKEYQLVEKYYDIK